MHKLLKILNVVNLVLLVCTFICGIWVGTHKESDMMFHAGLSAVSVIFAIILQLIHMNKCKYCRKMQKK